MSVASVDPFGPSRLLSSCARLTSYGLPSVIGELQERGDIRLKGSSDAHFPQVHTYDSLGS